MSNTDSLEDTEAGSLEAVGYQAKLTADATAPAVAQRAKAIKRHETITRQLFDDDSFFRKAAASIAVAGAFVVPGCVALEELAKFTEDNFAVGKNGQEAISIGPVSSPATRPKPVRKSNKLKAASALPAASAPEPPASAASASPTARVVGPGMTEQLVVAPTSVRTT